MSKKQSKKQLLALVILSFIIISTIGTILAINVVLYMEDKKGKIEYKTAEVANAIVDDFFSLYPLYSGNLAESEITKNFSSDVDVPGWYTGDTTADSFIDILNDTYGIKMELEQLLYLVNANYSEIRNEEFDGFVIYYGLSDYNTTFIGGTDAIHLNETLIAESKMDIIRI